MQTVTEYNLVTLWKVTEKMMHTIVIPQDKIDSFMEVLTASEDARYNSLSSITVSAEAMAEFQELAKEVRRFMVRRGMSELNAVKDVTLGDMNQLQRESPKTYEDTVRRTREAQALMQDAMNMAMAINAIGKR